MFLCVSFWNTGSLSSHSMFADPLLLNECGICHQRRDQHLLAKCDTCHLYYHLNCLNPPLTRLPKKSKLYGWQCSECDKTSDSDVDVKEKGARRSRTRHSKDNLESHNEVFAPKVIIKPVEPHYSIENSGISESNNHVSSHHHNYSFNNSVEQTSNTLICTTSIDGSEVNNDQCYIIGGKSGKKRRRDKHRSHSTQEDGNPSREHKRKRKKKSLDIENPNNNSHPRITIKVCIRYFRKSNSE